MPDAQTPDFCGALLGFGLLLFSLIPLSESGQFRWPSCCTASGARPEAGMKCARLPELHEFLTVQFIPLGAGLEWKRCYTTSLEAVVLQQLCTYKLKNP